MKKSVKMVILASVVMMAVLITSCIFYKGTAVTEELKSEILEDYLLWSGIQGDKKPEEIDCEFFGKYGDSVAVYFHTSGAYETLTDEEVAGYTFSYPDSRVIRIWNKGKFYKMSEAYEKWFISKENVEWIYANYINMSFTEPEFIFEDKEYVEVSLDDAFAGNCILVQLDRGISGVNKEHSKEFFAGVDIDYIVDLTYTEREVDEERRRQWFQILALYLPYDSKEKVIEGIKIIEKIDGVKCVHQNAYIELDYLPNDPYFLTTTLYGQWGHAKIQIEKAWEFSKGSNDIRVGVIDTGISSHIDLNDNYSAVDAFDFYNLLSSEPIIGKTDENSHGTHVAGIIGAKGNNAEGVSGINWNISLVQLRSAEAPVLEIVSVLNAINWAENN